MNVSTFVLDKFIQRIIEKLNKLFFIFERRNPYLRVPFFLVATSNLIFSVNNLGAQF